MYIKSYSLLRKNVQTLDAGIAQSQQPDNIRVTQQSGTEAAVQNEY